MTTLDGNGIPRRRLAAMLERIDASARESGDAGVIAGYLSSHPVTRERLEAIRGGATP
jgi:predicted Zn-dependent protease